jgi:hypothetical protein
VDGKPLQKSTEIKNLSTSFKYKKPVDNNVNLKWLDNWKVKADMNEMKPDYNDSDWTRTAKPKSLEEMGLLEHGYVLYRSQFELPPNPSNVQITYIGNDIDRQYVYLNGSLVWTGITENNTQKMDIDDKIVSSGSNCLTALYVNTFHNKSHPHEGEILKYSGIMQPVLVNGDSAGKPFSTCISDFKVREHLNGIIKGYTKNSFDDSDWMDLPTAEKYVISEEMGNIVWFRRKFEYQCKKGVEAAVSLTIPDADQRCVFYLNGKPLGQFESVGPQHKFYVPNTFLQKENVLSIILEGSNSFILEPKLDTFYEAIDTEVEIDFKE